MLRIISYTILISLIGILSLSCSAKSVRQSHHQNTSPPKQLTSSIEAQYKLNIGGLQRDKRDPVSYAIKIISRPKMSEKLFLAQTKLIHRQASKLDGRHYYSPTGKQKWRITEKQYIKEVLPHVWANNIILKQYLNTTDIVTKSIKQKLLDKAERAFEKLNTIKKICREIPLRSKKDYQKQTRQKSLKAVNALIKEREKIKDLLASAFNDYPYVTHTNNIRQILAFYSNSQCFDDNWDYLINNAKKYVTTNNFAFQQPQVKDIESVQKSQRSLKKINISDTLEYQEQRTIPVDQQAKFTPKPKKNPPNTRIQKTNPQSESINSQPKLTRPSSKKTELANFQIIPSKNKVGLIMKKLQKEGATNTGNGTIASVITNIKQLKQPISNFVGYAYPLGVFYTVDQVLNPHLALFYDKRMSVMIKTKQKTKKGHVFNGRRYFIIEGMSTYTTLTGNNNALLIRETNVIH